MRALLAMGCLAAGLLSACTTAAGTPVELSMQQVCLDAYKDDALGRDQCLQDSRQRGSTVQDVRPQDLPIRTGQPGE